MFRNNNTTVQFLIISSTSKLPSRISSLRKREMPSSKQKDLPSSATLETRSLLWRERKRRTSRNNSKRLIEKEDRLNSIKEDKFLQVSSHLKSMLIWLERLKMSSERRRISQQFKLE